MLKIIKHYQEEGQGSEVVQGVLLGLVVDDRLEITNCFPFPQHTEDDADFDEGNWEQCSLSVYSIDSLLQLEKCTHPHTQNNITTESDINAFWAQDSMNNITLSVRSDGVYCDDIEV